MMRVLLLFIAFSTAFASQEKVSDVAKVSEAFGHLIRKNLETLGVDLDLDLVVKGLKDASKGKNSPLSESECIEFLSAAQEKAFQKQAEQNLVAAEAFLKKNASKKNVISLEEGKIQYRIEKKGKGPSVQEGSTPSIKYVGMYLDGSVFGQSDQEQAISLEETILGFNKGLIGMREGEKRTLFIHPDHGYGKSGYLQPNSLLTFEIELVKANADEGAFDEALILDGETRVEGLDSSQVR